jgi:uncharacterized protein (DUF2147 family)
MVCIVNHYLIQIQIYYGGGRMKHYIKTGSLLLVAGIFSLVTSLAQAGVGGCWQTYDDKTGKKKGLVRISNSGGKLSGRIVRTFHLKNDICSYCPKKYRNLRGKTILWGLKPVKGKSNQWTGGTIVDPKTGKSYRAKATLSGSTLKVRGYMGVSLLGRTQTWRKSGC